MPLKDFLLPDSPPFFTLYSNGDSLVETQNLASHVLNIATNTYTYPLVETQNLASHVESIATHAHNNAFMIKDLPICETQDFASLLFRQRNNAEPFAL